MSERQDEGYLTELEYTNGYFTEQNPVTIAATLQQQGRVPPDISGSFSYLELGCGNGLTSNVIACCFPDASVTANDFNPAHIANARRHATAAGLDNVTFTTDSFQQLAASDDLPAFDLITLHGIYTWVSPDNQAALQRIIDRQLAPGGVVMVSYNTLPGWAHLVPFRDLLREVGQRRGGPVPAQVEAGLALARELADVGSKYLGAARAAVPLLQRTLRTAPLAYVAHEYFTDDWQPLYHTQLRTSMERLGLRFAGNCQHRESLVRMALPERVHDLLERTEDPALRELLLDYQLNRTFRYDLYQRRRPAPSGTIPPLGYVLCMPTEAACALARTRASRHRGCSGPIARQVVEALIAGPHTMPQLRDRCAALPEAELTRHVAMLVGMGLARPCLSQPPDARVIERVRALHRALLAVHGTDPVPPLLLSPRLRDTLPLATISSLLALAEIAGAPDETAFCQQFVQHGADHGHFQGELLSDEALTRAIAEQRTPYQRGIRDHLVWHGVLPH